MGRRREAGQQVRVAAYEMSIHFGICVGPVDGLHRIITGEKVAWEGFATSEETYEIDKPELYGGEEKEGGVVGAFRYLPGNDDQVLPDSIASKWGLTGATSPAFRGVATLFFGSDSEFESGFTWAANNPYLKPVWATVRRAPVGLEEDIALIERAVPLTPVVVDPNSIVFFDGFDSYDHLGRATGATTTQGGGGAFGQNGGMWTRSQTGPASLVPGRFGGQAMYLQDTGTVIMLRWEPTKQFRSGNFVSGDHFSVGFNLKFGASLHGSADALYPIGGFTDGANTGALCLYYERATKKFSVRRGVNINSAPVSSSTFVAESDVVEGVYGEWRSIEMEVSFHNTTGYIRVYVEGELVLDFDGDTIYDNADTFGLFNGFNNSSNQLGHYFDDFYVKTGEPLGRCRIVTLLPTSDYLTEWTGGTPPYWSTLDDAATGQITTTSTAHRLAFGFEALPSFGPIYAVAVHEIAERSAGTGGAAAVGFVIEHETSDTFHEVAMDTSTPTVEPGSHQAYFQDNPNTGEPWTTSQVNNVKAGVRNTNASGTHATSLVALNVIYGFSESSSEELDANPAHIIFECMTNTEWGMGAPESLFDMTTFDAVAITLFEENFGLSMIWTRQMTIENFVQEVLDHIQATLFIHPRTGLWNLKLIRGDYVVASLPVLTADNCTVTDFSRKTWGDTTNEIVVTWTNPENEQEETVSLQDLANIAIQGGVVSDGRNYYGVRYRELAMRLAARDLAAAAAPLASLSIVADRASGIDFLPGGVFKLTYPELGLNELVVRISNVDRGKPRDSKIKISVVEDIFANAVMAYVEPTGSEWVDTSETPTAMEFVQPFTQPAYVVANTTGDLGTLDAAETRVAMLAARVGTDTTGFDLLEEVILPNGDLDYASVGFLNQVGYTTLAVALDAEADTILDSDTDYATIVGGAGPSNSGFVIFGEGGDEDMEIALVQSKVGNLVTLVRGVLDTVPRAWPIDTPVWFLGLEAFVYDPTTYAVAEEVDYRLLTRTSLGALPEGDAPIVTWETTARPAMPLRPANVEILGTKFGTVDATGETSGTVDVTWSNRNRLDETSIILGWEEAGVTPEAGQTTTITLLALDDTVITTIDGLTGETYTLDLADFGAYSIGRVRLTSKRDGIESLQGHEIIVIAQAGYGFGYGYNYGGSA